MALSAQGLVYDPTGGDRHNDVLLAKVMPELQSYSGEWGAVFRSRKLPKMRLLMHTAITHIPGAEGRRQGTLA